VLVTAAGVALLSARWYAGSWNDGSRLATVEALVDSHTLAIDDSVFVDPAARPAGAPAPYPDSDQGLMATGTCDKLWIDGHFYSDKSPVPALMMAGGYQVWQGLTGVTAREQADWFCFGLTLLSSGLAYVVAVWCIFRTGALLGLTQGWNLALTGSFALATVALPYARHVNNHELLLGITAALVLGLAHLARANRLGRPAMLTVIGVGSLAGLGYTVDLGAGPVLLVCTAALVAYRLGWRAAGVCVLAAGSWLVLHHAVNYAVGGTWKPANAVPEYFLWPGCPFNPQNMTGAWNHDSVGHFLTYAAALLVGKNGFLGHNLPLSLAFAAILVFLGRRTAERAEIVFAGFCCGGIWLVYALTSNNYSGQCCSIRWFVPLLAPAYFVLAVALRELPQYRGDFLLLSGWGSVIAGLAWWEGPWMKHMVPFYWPLQAGALASWLALRGWKWRQQRRQLHQGEQAGEPAARAA
jgi:hypothetical protein